MLVTLKNNIDNKSFFTKSDFKFYDLVGNELNFKSLLVKDDKSNAIIILVLTVILLFIIVLFLFYRFNKKNQLPIKETIIEESIPKFIFIRADRANHKILIDDILSVEGKKDYVKLQLDSKSYLVRKNLKTFLMDLPSSKFARISKSVAVNLEKISKIEKNIVYLNSEDYHVISKNYVNDINDLLI
jgi:DNA-binding LytR/AlgR family response regulator